MSAISTFRVAPPRGCQRRASASGPAASHMSTGPVDHSRRDLERLFVVGVDCAPAVVRGLGPCLRNLITLVLYCACGQMDRDSLHH